MCACVCLGGSGYVCVPCRLKHNTEHVHTLNSISEALRWFVSEGAVKGCGAEYVLFLIGLNHDWEGHTPS